MGQAMERLAPTREASLIAALSELAARVQRGRTLDEVLETAGQGVLALGMRLGAFQIAHGSLVLRYIASAKPRVDAIEQRIGRPLHGMRAPLAEWDLVRAVVNERRTVYREDLDLFDRFLRAAAGIDTVPLQAAPETARIPNGVLAPLYVRDEPWGLLAVFAPNLTRDDADAVALFATHVGSALEVAETIEALERTNRELVGCYADLARAQKELVKRERLAALGELAAVVAHEVRNPLCVLFNSIGALRRMLRTGMAARAGDDAEALLTIADEEAERLNRIVTDLLDFARPREPDFRSCSLADVIREALAAAPADGCVALDLAPDLPRVEMDARLMRQALLNLFLNGLQAMPKSGTLTVRALGATRSGAPCARVEIADTGPGIPKELHDTIFQPFFTTKASGTGLGLAVVRRIVESHRGDLEMASSPAGTTFAITLPTSRSS